MRGVRLGASFAALILCGMAFRQAHAGFGDFFNRARESVGGKQGMSESKIVSGLKEALEIGTGNAVTSVSKVGGYYENAAIKIPLPESIRKVEGLLRGAGYGAELDAFELSMNRAAEAAAPEAKNIFWGAIREMTVSDGKKILNGRDNEATLYFKDKTYDRLGEIFRPVVHSSMSQVGVTRRFQELDAQARQIPFVGGFGFDLDEYVTSGSLDGLFFMVGEEEKKIRQNPAARVTDLLEEVFGN